MKDLNRLQRDLAAIQPYADLAKVNGLIGSRESELMRAAMGLGRTGSSLDAAARGIAERDYLLTRAGVIDPIALNTASGRIERDIAKQIQGIMTTQTAMDQAYGSMIGKQMAAGGFPATVMAARDAARAFEANYFTRPEQDVLARMAKVTAGAIHAHSHWRSALGWDQELYKRMDRLTGDWAISDALGISGLAFGELSLLRDVVHFDDPYAPPTRDYVEEEFGEVVDGGEAADDIQVMETRYDEAGRDPTLIAFPAQQFPNIIVAAGFSLEIPAPPVPQPISNLHGPVAYGDEYHSMLRSTEVHLRGFVERELFALEGQLWVKRRVPGTTSSRWTERRNEARDLNLPVYDLIHYSDFNDLGQIIGQRNNWNDVFETYFGDKEGVQVSLRRLSPLRNGDAHNRPFCASEILYLAAESVRLLRAIRVVQ